MFLGNLRTLSPKWERARRTDVYPSYSGNVTKICINFLSLDVKPSKMIDTRYGKTFDILFATLNVNFSKYFITVLINMDSCYICLLIIGLERKR